jgi:hypothetical protein
MKLNDMTESQGGRQSLAWPLGESNVDCFSMIIDDDTLKQLLRITMICWSRASG